MRFSIFVTFSLRSVYLSPAAHSAGPVWGRSHAVNRTVEVISIWSCTRPLRIIILPPNRVQCPQLNPFWRGQGHGLTPVLLPTRSVSHPMALRHVACRLV